jgi:methionyl-tRNA formyltransferase
MRRLRLVFMGTPAFGVPVLDALLDAGHEVLAVYCRPPRPAGRGQGVQPAPVHAFATSRGLEVRTPTSLKGRAEEAAFAALGADAAVVAAYGLILPAPVLAAPRLGCLNVHPSLLPRWRGAAPMRRAILAGDPETGVTIMVMDEGLDTGAILLADAVPIDDDTTAGRLEDALAGLGARLIVEALAGLDQGRLEPRPQPAEGATHAPKLTPAEERLDWRLSARDLARGVRALSPRPGAWFEHEGMRIRVLAGEAVARLREAAPGTVLDDALEVACGDGALRLEIVQRAGRKAMDAKDFLRGRPIPAGTVLECPA